MEELNKVNELLVYQLGDCLMDIFDEFDISHNQPETIMEFGRPYWSHILNSRHGGYFDYREMGILIQGMYRYQDVRFARLSNNIDSIRPMACGLLSRRISICPREGCDIFIKIH